VTGYRFLGVDRPTNRVYAGGMDHKEQRYVSETVRSLDMWRGLVAPDIYQMQQTLDALLLHLGLEAIDVPAVRKRIIIVPRD